MVLFSGLQPDLLPRIAASENNVRFVADRIARGQNSARPVRCA